MKLRPRLLRRIKRHPPPGAQPGTLVMPEESPPPRVHLISYNPQNLEERDVASVDGLAASMPAERVTWIDVQGLGDEAALRSLATQFGLHPLTLEDIVNAPQRPKIESLDRSVFVIVRMAQRKGDVLDREQVSLIVGENYVLSFQERPGDVFDPVRARIRAGGPVFRNGGAGYLAYALIDAVIDGYYPVLEWFGEALETVEQEILAHPQPSLAARVHRLKRELLALRRGLWPMREMLGILLRDEVGPFDARLRVQLRDCQDHCTQLIDVLETYRELAGGLMDMYLSSVANRQNEVMKTLTIMASLFIPLTFLAGIYGMNFQHMPELHSRWGYPVTLGLMAVIALGMLTYFYRRGWLWQRKADG